jgi:hypothetical protein
MALVLALSTLLLALVASTASLLPAIRRAYQPTQRNPHRIESASRAT